MKKLPGLVFLFAFLAVFAVAYTGNSSSYYLELALPEGTQYLSANSSTYNAFFSVGQLSGFTNNSNQLSGYGFQRSLDSFPRFLEFGSSSGTRAPCCGPFTFSTVVQDKFGVDAVLLEFDNLNHSAVLTGGTEISGTWAKSLTAPGTALFSFKWWAHNKAGLWNKSFVDTFEAIPVSASTTTTTPVTPTTVAVTPPTTTTTTTTGSVPPSTSEPVVVPPVVSTVPVVVPQQEVITTEEVTTTAEDGSSVTGQTGETFTVVDTPNSASGQSTVLEYSFTNGGSNVLENVLYKKEIPNTPYKGPSPLDYPDVNWGTPLPIRVDEGSAIGVWQFDVVRPGETVKVQVTIDGALDKQTLAATKPAVVAVAKAVAPDQVSVTPAPSQAPVIAPAQTDWTMLIIAGILVLLVAGYFLTKKPSRPKGL